MDTTFRFSDKKVHKKCIDNICPILFPAVFEFPCVTLNIQICKLQICIFQINLAKNERQAKPLVHQWFERLLKNLARTNRILFCDA